MKLRLIRIQLTTLLLTVSSFVGISQATSVLDATYFNNDNAQPPIRVGKGFHVNDVYKQTRSCFTPESATASKLTPQQTSGKKTSVKVFYTKTNEEYNNFKSRGISGKVSCLNLFSFGGKKLEEYSNKTINEEERIIFYANVDFGVYSFESDPVLNAEAKALKDAGNSTEFVTNYGTHFISGVKKESNIIVILTKSGSKQTDSQSEQNNVSIGGKIPFKGSGSLEVENGNWTNTELSSNKFTASIEINGPGIQQSDIQSQINNVLNGTAEDKALAIGSIIEGALKNISDPNQSIYTQYYYTPFELLGVKGVYWDDKKETKLAKINEKVIEVYGELTYLDEMLSNSGRKQLEESLSDIPQQQSAKIIQKFDDLTPNFKELKNKAQYFLTLLESNYNSCSNVYCQTTSDCCNYENLLNEITEYNLEKKIDDEMAKLENVVDHVEEELSKPECEKQQTGSIVIINESTNPYYLYQGDNLIKTLPGSTQITYNVKPGVYYFKAEQKSGHLVYPTVNYRTAKLSQVCQEVRLRIGFED